MCMCMSGIYALHWVSSMKLWSRLHACIAVSVAADPPVEGEELPDPQVTRFRNADTNGDGHLDKTEFVPFVHPFRHEHMLEHLVEDQLSQYDHNHDGMISLEEYTRNHAPFSHPSPSLDYTL